MNQPELQPNFVLVHGAFSDASVWARIGPALVAAGATFTALDLPSHTPADNPKAGLTTLADYVAAVERVVAATPHSVVLVGHSLGGMTITQVAEDLPEKIAALVYVCALLPADGRSASSYTQHDTQSAFGAYLQPEPERGVATVSREGLETAIFSQTRPADREAALRTILEEPLQPFVAEVHTTAARFGTIPRYYIATLNDRAITPAVQQSMFEALPCSKVYSLDADHMPMMSAPAGVIEALLDVRAQATARLDRQPRGDA